MGVEAKTASRFTTAMCSFHHRPPPSSSATFCPVSHPSLSFLLSHVCAPLSPFSTACSTPSSAAVGESDERDLGVRFPDQRPPLECAAFYADPTKHCPFTRTSPASFLGTCARPCSPRQRPRPWG
jgi:hypothetical protein